MRTTASAERPAHDLDADNAVDTAVLSMADLDLERWHADGAAETLRDRFVTGESCAADPQAAMGRPACKAGMCADMPMVAWPCFLLWSVELVLRVPTPESVRAT